MVRSGRGSACGLASRDRGGWTTAVKCLLSTLFAASPWVSDAFAAEDATGQSKPQASATATCRDCGVVRSIREIRTERKPRQDTYVSSQQYLQARPFDQQPLVGPAISFSWGGGTQTQPRVGAVGSPEMQQRFIEISYEITVRFDDGRYGLIEQADPDDLIVGDRVKVVKGLVQRWK
jgi:hypothetical protein